MQEVLEKICSEHPILTKAALCATITAVNMGLINATRYAGRKIGPLLYNIIEISHLPDIMEKIDKYL